MKKLIFLSLIVPVFSFAQTPYTSYYENGKIQLTGEHYELYTEYKVSAESGLNLRESPDLKSKKVAKLPFGLQLKLLSKTGEGLTIIDTDKETGIKKEIKGEWVEVIGYIVVDYDKENIKHRSNNSILLYKLDGVGGPDPWQDENILKQTPQIRLKVKGYVFDGFIEKIKKSLQKGVWTHYAESGVITKEEFYVVEEFDNPLDSKGERMAITQYNNHFFSMGNVIKLNGQIKTIQFDVDGGISEILEQNIELVDSDYNFGPDRISNTFHSNGKIKCVNESSGGGAVNYCLDKNGKPLGLNNYGIGDERLILSKDIRDFKLTHRLLLQKNRIELEQKLFIKPTEFENGRWISTVDSLSGIEIKNGKWIMFYKNGENESTDVYDFKIRGEYVNIFGSELKLDKYLTITNDRSGTLEYYIIEYSNKLLSLSYLPRGNTLNYKPEK